MPESERDLDDRAEGNDVERLMALRIKGLSDRRVKPHMPKIDLEAIEPKRGSDYPAPYHLPLAGREVRSVGRAAGLEDFNANHVILPPGCWSSQRHWHGRRDRGRALRRSRPGR